MYVCISQNEMLTHSNNNCVNPAPHTPLRPFVTFRALPTLPHYLHYLPCPPYITTLPSFPSVPSLHYHITFITFRALPTLPHYLHYLPCSRSLPILPILPVLHAFFSETCSKKDISTGLGYTCHLLFLLSKYLEVNLRYQPAASG